MSGPRDAIRLADQLGRTNEEIEEGQLTGLETNMLRPSIAAAGLDPSALPADLAVAGAAELYGGAGSGPKRWRDIWSAGHSVSGVRDVPEVATLIDRLGREFAAATGRTVA